MPIPTDDHIILLGPPVLPFERQGFIREILDGEDILFNDRHYNATEDGKPDDVIEVNPETIDLDPMYGRYLWIITERGLHIILEQTPNPDSARGIVCHSNLTGGQSALQGGELWFGTDNKIYINYRSGRYGAESEEQQAGVIEYFKYVGYNEIVVID